MSGLISSHEPLTRVPILILYPHSRCNCRCVMCDIWRAGDTNEIDPDLLAEMIVDWKALGVEEIVLSGGEALMHRRIEELLALLHRSAFRLTLLSTGLLLERHAEAVARTCAEVVLSLDGPEPVHDAIRRVRHPYRKMATGLLALNRQRSDLLLLGRCTVQKGNHRELRATVAAARELGLHHISFLAVDLHSSAFNRPADREARRGDDVALSPADIDALAEELDRLIDQHAADFESGFIVESQEKLRRRLVDYFRATHGRIPFVSPRCNAPWVSAVLESDGTLRPCFFQPAYGEVDGAHSLRGLINSDAALAFRRDLNVAENEICRRCVCSLALRRSEISA